MEWYIRKLGMSGHCVYNGSIESIVSVEGKNGQ